MNLYCYHKTLFNSVEYEGEVKVGKTAPGGCKAGYNNSNQR